jgi:hypothetical protein
MVSKDDLPMGRLGKVSIGCAFSIEINQLQRN